MFKQAICLFVVIAGALAGDNEPYQVYKVQLSKDVEPVYGPQPYQFGYRVEDEFGSQQRRDETSDQFNTKTGSYGYRDAHGIYREVHYIADKNGFRATIRTNEPGTLTSTPSNAQFDSLHQPQAHPNNRRNHY